MTHILTHFRKDQDALVIASHNVESCELGYELMNELGLLNENIIFGQLKAFSDHLTYKLSARGLKVVKYLPYGPTEYLIPYLMRRG